MKVARHASRIEDAGATAVAVVHDEPARVRDLLLADLDWPFPLALDDDRTTYRAWGLRRAPWWRIWLDPKVWAQYARHLAAGHRIRGAGADLRQLGGDFVVAADGRVAWSRPQHRDDRPPAGQLLRILEETARDS